MINVIVFDLCDTIVQTAGVPGLLSLPGLTGQLRREDIEQWFVNSEVFRDYERGRVDTDAFVDAFFLDLNVRAERSEFLRVYEALVLREIDGMAELVRQCADRYPLYALSNNNPLLWRATQRICSVLDCFSHIFLSHEIGLLKRDPRAYQHALDNVGCTPEESVLIDDNPRCIDAARQLGMHAVHFTDAAETARALSRLMHGESAA